MGLDQTAYTKNKKGVNIIIQDWRKHNALDGWMEALWRVKGNDGYWGGSELELEMNDIKQLEEVVVNDDLPENCRFFFGRDSRFSKEKKKETLKFIFNAYDTLRGGNKVFYSSWF